MPPTSRDAPRHAQYMTSTPSTTPARRRGVVVYYRCFSQHAARRRQRLSKIIAHRTTVDLQVAALQPGGGGALAGGDARGIAGIVTLEDPRAYRRGDLRRGRRQAESVNWADRRSSVSRRRGPGRGRPGRTCRGEAERHVRLRSSARCRRLPEAEAAAAGAAPPRWPATARSTAGRCRAAPCRPRRDSRRRRRRRRPGAPPPLRSTRPPGGASRPSMASGLPPALR